MSAITLVPDIGYAAEGASALLMDLYLPKEKTDFPLLIFFYGGGLEAGDKDNLASMARTFADSGIAVAVPNYRLFPTVSYPAFIEDAAKSVAWVKKHIHEYGSCKKIFVGGHSAGAYLAMMLCFDKSYLSAQGIDADELGGYIFGSGQPTTHFNVLKYRGEDPRRVIIDEAAPIFHIRSTGAPLLILCADNDMENRLPQTQLMVTTLHHFCYDNEVDFQILYGHDHGSYLEPKENQPSKFFEIASDFIQRNS